MNQLIASIRQFRLRSVFFRFYSYIFLLITIFTLVFAIYVHRMYISNYVETQQASMEAFLSQSVDYVDNSIRFMAQSLMTLSENTFVTSSVITPSEEDVSSHFETALLLRRTEGTSLDYERIFLYEDTKKMVFSSQGSIDLLQNSDIKQVLEECIGTDRYHLLELQPHRMEAGILPYEDSFLIAVHFIPATREDRYLGLLAAQLNLEHLFSPLIVSLSESPYQLRITSPEGDELLWAGTMLEARSREPALTRTSSYSGCRFELYAPVIDVSLSNYLHRVFPLLLFLLMIGFVLSFFIALTSYYPIHNLLTSVIGQTSVTKESISPEDAKAAPANELDMVARDFLQLRTEHVSAQAFLDSARPEIESGVLMGLMAEDWSEEMIDSVQFKSIGSKLREDGFYQCFLISFGATIQAAPIAEYIQFKMAKEKMSEALPSEDCSQYFIRLDNHRLCAVLQYPQDISAAGIKRMRSRYLQSLTSLLKELGEGVFLTYGSAYHGLQNVQLSYREALLQQHQDISSAKKETAVDEQSQEAYFAAQSAALDELFAKGDLALADELIARYLKDLTASGMDLPTRKQCCDELLNLLDRQFLLTAMIPENEKPDISAMREEIHKAATPSGLYTLMTRETAVCMSVLNKYMSQKKYKLAANAREYINQHYADSNLSMQEIAESVGVSNAYLSTAYAEATGENLVQYLNQCRVDAASQLLRDSSLIIKEIAARTGFSTIQNFNRVFKKCTGLTPGEYRKKMLASQKE